jgi:putative transposase
MRCRFVAAERARSPVRRLGRAVGVAASGFDAWLRRGPRDRSLAGRIGTVVAASRGT